MTLQTQASAHRTPGLLARAALAAIISLVLVTVTAAGVGPRLAQDDAFPWRVAAIYGAIMAAALATVRRSHPYKRLGPANLVTGLRAMLMALLAGVALAPGSPATGWSLVLLASCGALADALDGPLARRSGLASRFGARFDMEIDALLILVLSGLAWRVVPVGAWVLASGLLRYAFVVAGWVWPWMAADLPPSRRRQAVCVVQIVALVLALLPIVTTEAASALCVAGLALLSWSFWVDVTWLRSPGRTP